MCEGSHKIQVSKSPIRAFRTIYNSGDDFRWNSAKQFLFVLYDSFDFQEMKPNEHQQFVSIMIFMNSKDDWHRFKCNPCENNIV